MNRLKKCMVLFLSAAMILQCSFTSFAEETELAETAPTVTTDGDAAAEEPGAAVLDSTVPSDDVAAVDTTDETAANGEESPADVENTNAAVAAVNEDGIAAQAVNELKDGVNVIKEGAEGMTFNIDEGKCVMIEGTDEDPIIFKNCTFNLSGKTVKISGNQGVSYYNGETATKLFIGKNVQFDGCTFVSANGMKSTSNGWDACIYFFSGEIVLNNCTATASDYQGQFLGLYGSTGSVTFNNSTIATTGNTGGWSYAMYGASVLNLNSSTMTATGMKPGESNVNAFYSGDLRTNYDAINIENSTINFSDNKGGGFAINNVNIHVVNSKITVNDNAGNACNSGYWIVSNSEITMNGNRGGHALSCIGVEMTDSSLEILHNGYAGLYIQSRDSSFVNSNVNIHCNGEKLLSYSAGDTWLNTHTATFTDCESVWLGAVGRKGTVVSNNCPYFVAYDLYENKTKSNTEPVLDGVVLSEQDEHVLFLNPDKDFDYARGDTEGKTGNSNDDDLFEDVTKETAIGKDTAKIGTLTTAQLSHHIYDWNNSEVTDQAAPEAYGVKRYSCIDDCESRISWTEGHPNSFNCDGTYVYAPLVGLTFDANVPEEEAESVTGIPDAQTAIDYGTQAIAPETEPVRPGYKFTGWYKDADCTEKFNFENGLEENWTTVYAGWVRTATVVYQWVGDVKPGDVTAPVDENEYVYGDVYSALPQETTKEAYTFDGWYLDEKCTVAFKDGTKLDEEVLNENYQLVLYGKWSKNPAKPTGDKDKPTAGTDKTTKRKQSPKTGDENNMLLWIVLLGVSAAGLAGAGTAGKKVNRRRK